MINLSTVVTQKKIKSRTAATGSSKLHTKQTSWNCSRRRRSSNSGFFLLFSHNCCFGVCFAYQRFLNHVWRLAHCVTLSLFYYFSCKSVKIVHYTQISFGVPSALSIRRNIIPALRIDNPIDNQPEDKDQTLGDNWA